MNLPTQKAVKEHIDKECLPDIQCSKPNINIPIMQVGVENVEVPFKLESKSGGFNELVANVSLRTSLDHQTKGISMSRLLLTLKPYLDLPLKSKLIEQILKDVIRNVGDGNPWGANAAFMKFDFRMPIKRKSIKSDNEFPIYYKCRFEGQLYDVQMTESSGNKSQQWFYRFFQGVTVQYASYCPCSAELCSVLDSQGFPHNQRSFANVLIEKNTYGDNYIWLEDIIHSVESVIPTLPYPVIKRIDEQEIARVAGENPMFVEDAIRAISQSVDNIDGVIDWIVKCSHEESIHTSEAVAINWKGVTGGFDGRRFI
jgi:GTP cyclohydrolase I